MRRIVAATLLIVAPAAALVLLVRLGSTPGLTVDWNDPVGWLRRARPEDAVAAVARLAAIGVCGWLIVAAGLGLVASFGRSGAAGRVAHRVAGRHVMGVIERALAVSVVTGATFTMATPIGAGPPPSAEVEIDVRTGRADPPRTLPTPIEAPAAPRLAGPTPPVAASEHVVAAGESLWSIAADEVARRSGRGVSELADAEVAEYWIEVLAANHGRMLSGDPNLIYAGEAVTLPT